MLSGHTDVVPVDGQDWTRPPFELTEGDGLLYGRGAADMKGFCAAALAAARRAEVRTRVRALLFDGRAAEALELLASTGLRETGLIARAEVMRGNIEAGLSILPEDERREMLFDAVCERLKSLRMTRDRSRTCTSTPNSQLGTLSIHTPGGNRSLDR